MITMSQQAVSTTEPTNHVHRKSIVVRNGAVFLIAPAVLFLLAFFAVPLLYILLRSFENLDFNNYLAVLQTPVYLSVILRTFQTCFAVTLLTILVGYPYAYVMSISKGWTLLLLTGMILLPFWVSLLLRTYAWLVLLQDTGLVNKALMASGLIETPIPLVRNLVGVTIGMTHILLPYAVLPMYSAMSKIDMRYMEAATISGAGPVRAFLRVYLPLSLPGVIAAAVLVFTLGLGFYITPALLGGPRDTLIGQLIASSVQVMLDLPFASALSVVLLLLTVCVFVTFSLAKRVAPGMRYRRGSL